MKKFLILVFSIMLVFGIVGSVNASTVTFDFEKDVTLDLDIYMDNTFNGNVAEYNTLWYQGPYTCAIWTDNENSARLDFDPDDLGIKIESLSFDWKILDDTDYIDFGLDVYNDLTETWIINYYYVTSGPDPYTWYSSGSIEFDPSLEITQIAFHDSEIYDVGIDNLTINYSQPVPEPTTMLLLGSGLMGLVGFRKKFKKK